MKIYRIQRDHKGDVHVEVVDIKRKENYPLVHVGTHSDGFEYGYYGSGPADLAWSLLANFFEESNQTEDEQEHAFFLSNKLHQRFKEDFVAYLSRKERSHVIYDTEILTWLNLLVKIDLKDYQTRRENYREANRLLDMLERKWEESPALADDPNDTEKWEKLAQLTEDYYLYLSKLEDQWRSHEKNTKIR
jgi:hypothetical protein